MERLSLTKVLTGEQGEQIYHYDVLNQGSSRDITFYDVNNDGIANLGDYMIVTGPSSNPNLIGGSQTIKIGSDTGKTIQEYVAATGLNTFDQMNGTYDFLQLL